MMAAAETNRRFAWWHEAVLFALLIGLIAFGEVLMPGFASARTQLFLSRHLWEFALLTLGMTFIILTGGIDLSIGSTMGLCAVVFGMTRQATDQIQLAVLACLFTGLIAGAVNGVLISRFHLHSLIVTLATYAAFRGIAEGISQGDAYSQFGKAFSHIARGTLLGLPWPGFVFLILAISCSLWLGLTPTGRYLYAIGYNERASRFSGIPVDRIRLRLYLFSGVLAGLATVIYISRFDTAKADAGKGFELDVITAVVVGGTSIYGGRGNLLGTILGLLLIHEVRLFVGNYWKIEELKTIVVGILLIASIMFSRMLDRRDRDLLH